MKSGCVISAVLCVIVSTPALADYVRTSRVTIVREDHSSDSEERTRLAAGLSLPLVTGTQRDGYYHVLLLDGSDGWVYRTFVRRFEGVPPSSSGTDDDASNAASPPPGNGAMDAAAFRSTTCPPEGRTQLERIRPLNRLKNRSVSPVPNAYVGTSLEDLLYPGNDETRWKDSQAIEVVAYVYDVKAGDSETCNCGAINADEKDTHIELTRGPDHAEPDERFIVEVTPTWRRFMRQRGVDWSTATLKSAIEHKWVRAGGWMFLDREHLHNASTTNPNGTKIWRGTAWEIHPVTALNAVPEPIQ